MVASFNDAISAYRNAASGKTASVAERVGGNGQTVNPGESFADMVKGAAIDARATMMNFDVVVNNNGVANFSCEIEHEMSRFR